VNPSTGIVAVHLNEHVGLVVLRDIRDRAGMGYELFQVFRDADITLLLISQSPGRKGHADLAVVVLESHLRKMADIQESLEAAGVKGGMLIHSDVALINFYGDTAAADTPGIAAQIFQWFALAGINVVLTAVTPRVFSAVIRRRAVDDLLSVLEDYADLTPTVGEV